MPRVRVSVLALLCAAALVAGCGGDDEAKYEPPTLMTVVADEAIRQPLIYLKGAWDASHDERAVLTLGTTSEMVEQVRTQEGGDVLITDDQDAMTAAREDGVISADPIAIATNHIVLGVPKNNDITGLADLEGLRWVECTANTTCARVTDAVQQENDFTDKPYQRLEPMDLLQRVTAGQAHAAFMWASEASEAAAAPLMRTVELPGAENHSVTYYIAPLTKAPHPEAAKRFIDLVTSAEGKRLIEQGKFALPTS